MKMIQIFSDNSDISLDAVLNMPFFFIHDFYESDAWKNKKQLKENDDQIKKNLFQLLINIRNLQRGR